MTHIEKAQEFLDQQYHCSQAIAGAFADWLLTDEAMLVMRCHDLFYMPTNPTAIATKAFVGKGHVLFEQPEEPMSAADRQRLLDRWVREVRMK